MADTIKNKILVIGDSCQDIYVYGKVDRLCPDAPVPILIPQRTTQTGGMALNVYENIQSLGVSVDIVTNKKMVTKTRYVEEKTNQMIIRVDSEKTLVPRIESLATIKFEDYGVVIISDYNKGFLEYEDIEYICKHHNNVFIDTKKIINSYLHHAKYIKINEVEYNNNLSVNPRLLDELRDKLIITMGNQGCKFKEVIYPVDSVEIKDMSGAGDTFISALAIEFLKSQDIDKAIKYANYCATIVVQHKGVTKIGHHLSKV